LDVLKLLRETYLNRVKMIYIDPPYNTGNDFVYEDDFSEDTDEFLTRDGQFDEQGNRLTPNLDSNGRFHTDWLNMIYPRLKVARDLMSDDGVILISIDDNEIENSKKICNEIFGEKNFVGEIIRKTKSMTGDNGNGFNLQHENLIIYAKNKMNVYFLGKEKEFENYSNPDNDPNGDWCAGDPSAKSGGDTTYFPIVNPYTKKVDYPPKGRYWAFSQNSLKNYIRRGKIKFKENYKENERGFIFKRYKNEAMNPYNPVNSLFATENEFMNQSATIELKELFSEAIFSYPKPTAFLYELIKCSATDDSDIILDFFSGSATTAHAVMQLNADDGGKRKFIMVQIPEPCLDNSEAAKAGYKNICEIGKERIRRAGKKIKEDNKDKPGIENLDIGFRVLKLDSSNMKDVYYTPEEYAQMHFNLDGFMDNIKPDRSDEDLLFQVMLELGIPLSAKIKQDGKIFYVNDNYLIACFGKIDTALITEIAKKKPYYAVFRDSSFISDSAMVNFEQVFSTYSPKTIRRVL
ncbi:MAG TPA: site-specific DNA-methyltransferase, partial [Porphyromonadaceae bacterium]|nr:site-specific DNA-methyltransferase [Porphyromonadaceae bacterium]